MTAQQVFFGLSGGLDQETPALAMPPGRIIAGLNHESVAQGYARTQGFERFDGQPAPSAAGFWTLRFKEGQVEPQPGFWLFGSVSEAKFRVLAVKLESGAYAEGTAEGTIILHLLEGSFLNGETLTMQGLHYSVVDAPPVEGDWLEGEEATGYLEASRAYARNKIEPLPGSGPVRGVLWYGGRLCAWRDNADASRGILHTSSATGWKQQDLGRIITFTKGGPYELKPGDPIKGDQSGAVGKVRYVALEGAGDWSTKDASGRLIIDVTSGLFGDETISSGANLAIAKVGFGAAENSFPAGGRYDFDVFNFYGSVGYERAYGVNGVGPAFEFDGVNAIPIASGMPEDKPFLVRAHKNHLFLAFPKGSLQHSELGAPLSMNARLGAAELGMGHEITSIIPNASNVLLVTTEQTIAALTGNDSSDWVLEGLSDDAGAKPHTAARVGSVIYLDNRGLRRVDSSSAYGNFKIGTFTAAIAPELDNKRKSGVVPVASVVVKSKDQYLLFFSDGSGISMFFGRKNPEPMLFEYPFVVSCLHLAEVDGVERLFVGATNGFVYELNAGTSFDGEEIEAFIALPFGYQGDPRALKRYHKAVLEMKAGPGSEVFFLPQFDYGNDYQPFDDVRSIKVDGGGGLWGLVNWNSFLWGATAVARTEIYLQGAGSNMSLIIRSASRQMDSYVLQGVTIMFSPRGRMR